jgi:hypothetical protein
VVPGLVVIAAVAPAIYMLLTGDNQAALFGLLITSLCSMCAHIGAVVFAGIKDSAVQAILAAFIPFYALYWVFTRRFEIPVFFTFYIASFLMSLTIGLYYSMNVTTLPVT